MVELLAAFSFISLLPFAAGGMIAVIAWAMMDWYSSRQTRSEVRLDELSDPTARTRRDDGREGGQSAMTKVLEAASPALASPLKPKSEKEASKLNEKLAHAGFRAESAQTIFLGMKFTGLVFGLMLGGGSLLLSGNLAPMTLIRVCAFVGGMFYAPDLIVAFIGKKRKESIFLGLPDALDLMVVCVEAGLGLDQAMRKVANEMKKSHRVIAEEFGIANMHLQMGRVRAEVLHDLGQRNGVEDLRALASIIIQADKFGSSIAQALRVQSDSMRTRRRQLAEERAQKTAVKLIFPLVLFIFPGIFVILVGPAAITMVREMLPMLGGRG